MGLAGYLPPIVAQIIADTGKFSAGMGEAEKKLGGLGGAFNKLAGVGKMAFAGIAVAAAAIGYESVKLAMGFDQAMELIHTQAGASQAEVEGLKDKVLALAPAVGIGPEKLAEGLYHIESTGFRGKAALDILAASAKLASTGLADLDTVTFAMSGTMSVGMKDIKDAADATSYLNTIVGMGDMKMGSLAAAIGTGVLPSFKSAGLGMTDFGAALATITDNSTPADEAATRLRMTVSLMAAPSHKAADALKSIGMTDTQLAMDMRKPNGLLVAVQDLKKHLGALKTDAEKVAAEKTLENAFGGGKTSGAILTLIDETDRLKSKYEAMGTGASRAKAQSEAWAQQQKQFSQQVKNIVAQLQAWGVKIGNWLIPKLQALMAWVSQHKQQAKELAIVIGVVLVAAIAAFALSMVVAAAEILIAYGPIVAGILLIGIIIYEFWKHWKTIWHWICTVVDDAKTWVEHTWGKFIGLFTLNNFKKIGDALFHDLIVAPAKFALNFVVGLFDSLIDHINSGIISSINAVTGLIGISPIPNIPHIPMLAKGGIVTGPTLALLGEAGPEMVTPLSGSNAGGDIVINQTIVTPDGQVLRNQQLRYARRAGLKPTQLFPASTGSLVRG
jgi:TP901 family phage tail tape measure protein